MNLVLLIFLFDVFGTIDVDGTETWLLQQTGRPPPNKTHADGWCGFYSGYHEDPLGGSLQR